MKPVPQNRLPEYAGFFAPIIREMKLDAEISVEQWMENLRMGYELRYLDMYLDNLDNPKHCLVLSKYPGIVRAGTVANVILIYSVPEERGNKISLGLMMNTIENYAKIYGAKWIVAASWSYHNARPIDKLWLSNGYEKESTIYTKTL